MSPRLSVVLLTWNEQANIGPCLRSLAAQGRYDFEVIVIDAASTDRTVERVMAAMRSFPVPLRLEVAPRRLSVGEARNLGASMARAPAVAFLSADATAEKGWVKAALEGLEDADLVYGPQRHDGDQGSLAAAVRGLRYHHFDGAGDADPVSMASHVNAAIRLGVLRAFPIGTDPASSALDDVLLARRAARAGHHALFVPGMAVRHRDVATLQQELAKNLREGHGWGVHAGEVGLHLGAMAWGALLALATGLLLLDPGPLTALLALGALYAPAARRAWRRKDAMPRDQLIRGALATPPFDLAFLLAYARGLLQGARQRRQHVATEGSP